MLLTSYIKFSAAVAIYRSFDGDEELVWVALLCLNIDMGLFEITFLLFLARFEQSMRSFYMGAMVLLCKTVQ